MLMFSIPPMNGAVKRFWQYKSYFLIIFLVTSNFSM